MADKQDDLFKDFWHKVKGKKDSKDEEERDEHEVLKKRYYEEKETLRDKFEQQARVIKENKIKQSLKEGKTAYHHKEVLLERVAYITIILVLISYLIIDLSFYHGADKVVEIDQEAASIAAALTSEETAKEETEAAKVEVAKNETAKPEEKNETPAVEEKALSGKILMAIDKVYTKVSETDDELGYIEKVVFTINNGKEKTFKPIVHVYAYDSEMDDLWETKPRGKYTYSLGIKSGTEKSGSITLSPKSFRNLDIKKSIRLTLNGTDEGYVTAVNKNIYIS